MIRLSANSLSSFGRCEQLYYNLYNREKQLREFQWSLEFGAAVHEVLGEYDYMRLGKAASREESVLAAVEKADQIASEWDSWQETTKYNSWNLARIPIWYDAKFGESNAIEAPIIPPSPRLHANAPNALSYKPTSAEFIEVLWEYEYNGVILNGRIDMFCSVYGENLLVDRKTTSQDIDGNFIDNFNPNLQFSLYLWVAPQLWPHMNINGLLCEAIGLKVGDVEFERFIIRRTKDELEEFELWLNYMIDRRKHLENRDEYNWLKNETQCFGCHFKKQCSSSKEERKRLWGFIK